MATTQYTEGILAILKGEVVLIGQSLTVTGEADTEVFTASAAHKLQVGHAVNISAVTGGAGFTAGSYEVATVPSTTTFTLTGVSFTTDITAGTLLTHPLKLVMVDTAAYSANLDTDKFLTIIPAADQIAFSPVLGSVALTIDTGTTPDQVMLDAADGTFTAVTGDPTEAVCLIYDLGDEEKSRLLVYADGAGVALTPNGNDVDFVIHASGLARWARA